MDLEPRPIVYAVGELRVEERQPGLWAVCDGGSVLNREGFFEYEPLSSRRDEAFMTRTRFEFVEALQRAQASARESRRDYQKRVEAAGYG